MWGWVHGLFKALFEQLFKPKPPTSVGTDPGRSGSANAFLQRNRARRNPRARARGNKNPSKNG